MAIQLNCVVLLAALVVNPLLVVASNCATNTIIQLLYIQDVSYSYNNDFANMQATITSLMASLDSKFYRREVAIASFSDKPIWPSGDGNGDYCYRKESSFSTDPQVAVDALESLTILSGLDWWESQLDAVKHGVLADNLGWERNDWQGGKRVMRVVMLGTDALPHEKGVFPSLPENSPSGCSGEDYPSLTAVKQLLADNGMTAIFVVTPDIDNEWTSLVAGWPSTHVLRLADPITDIVAVIESELEEICDDTTTTSTTTTMTTILTTPSSPCTYKVGLAHELCTDACVRQGMICDNAGQTLINTWEFDCKFAAEQLSGLSLGQPLFTPLPPHSAVGCLYSAQYFFVVPSLGGPVNCLAADGNPSASTSRVCCCIDI